MPEPETDKGRREFVRWLADSQRHRSIAMPKQFQIDPAWLQNEKLRRAAGFWSFAEIGLEYEPRSLVVSPDGMQVAVGTKSGSVHVARWNGGAWTPHQIDAAKVRSGGAAEVASPGAIRGLLFLDGETLIAGWGNGCLSLISHPAGESPEIQVVQPSEARMLKEWHLGLQRISRLVPLFVPGSKPPRRGNLAMAILSRGEICILAVEKGRYSSRWQSHPSPEWREKGALTDGLWDGGRLWLLTTRGYILTCEPSAGGALDLAGCRVVRRLPSPRPDAPFRRLAVCEAGLAVLAAESVTFLWFGPRPGELAKSEEHWFQVPSALDCAACLPYPVTAGNSPQPSKSLVWTVVSTAEPGLRWVSWAPTRPPMSAAANFAMAGGGSILYLAFGKQGPRAPLFLACGTRDHRLLIASVLDRPRCEDELDAQIAWLIEEVGSEKAQPLFRESAGLGWWHLLTKLQYDFGVEKGPPIPELSELRASELLSFTERNDLLDLSSRLVKLYRRHPPPRRSLDDNLRKWTFRLLRRANELGEHVARELAEILYEKLQSAWNQESADEIMLRSLGNFLRKWIFHGHTYGDKRTQLHQVFEHNQRCGRKLDALVYLTRLMRRRFDFLWETSLPAESWTPAVWGLAADEEGALSISSLGDGGLCALDENGRHLAWELDDEVRGSSDLVLSEDRLRLERQESQKFARLYRHGPYARFLWLRRLPPAGGAEPHYLLVFCLKGWRFGELRKGKGKPPGIYALWFHQVRGKSAPIRALRVEKAAWIDSSSELYGLCALREPEEREGRIACTLLAGTSGSWEQAGSRQPAPFVELDVEVGEEIRITPRKPQVKRFEKGERHIVEQVAEVPDAANNRCWALARCEDAEERVWVWCGFQDGSIRGYRYEPEDPDGHRWYEGGKGKGAAGQGAAGPRQRGLKATGPVWRLLPFQGPAGQRMLAYGTGDGVVGAVSIQDLEEKEPGNPIRVFLHLPGESPICGLVEYEDEDGQRYLLSADQRGVISVFDLNPVQLPEPAPAGDEEDRRGRRFSFPGLRVDQLNLEIPVRAVVPLSGAGALPRFLAGTGEARVHKLELRYPLYSRRRREVPDLFESLMWNDEGGRSVRSVLPPPVRGAGAGTLEEIASHAHQWLRVLAVGDVSLMRFSLWDELRRAGELIHESDEGADVAELERRFDQYERVLGELVEETYRRRPFSEDLAMAIWEEGAKVASCIARRVLRRAGDDLPAAEAARVEKYLEQYHRLNALCADLCNRWIGVDQSVQSIVLIDSFMALFDWTALALVASDPPGGRKAQEVREFLVYGLIQYRLSYPDTRVPFETLRVINGAITRAVVNVPRRSFRIQPRPSAPGVGLRIGFYDVMNMVGDVWERLGESLSYSDPLTTEITRFFSLALLLLPDCTLILGQVVSESRLSERGIDLAKLILKQARELQAELGIRDADGDGGLAAGLNRFDALISEVADLTIIEDDSLQGIEYGNESWAWRFLLDQAKRLKEAAGDGKEISDAVILAEQYHVFRTAAWLADLNRPSLLEGAAAGMHETAAWLAGDGRLLRYRHSHDYLRRLDGLREEVRREAGLQRPIEGKSSPSGGKREIQTAIKKCNDCLRELQSEHLFRPQRNHYEQVIRHWHDQLVKLADEAVIVLDIMDRFNRHVYRRSADALMDHIVNLAMQTAPISYLDRSGGTHQGSEEGHSLRTRILDRLESFPLISSVFEAGEYLVQNTHFAGALLTIARHYEDPSHWSSRETVGVDEIDGIVQEVARRTGISGDEKWRYVPPRAAGGQVPGTRVVWDLIVQEWATNVVKHSFRGQTADDRREGPFLKFGAQGIRGRRGAILLSSNAPYALSLAEDEREQFLSRSRKENEELLQRFFGLRERGNNSDPHGAGMGLFMIQRLAELWGMEVRLELTEIGKRAGPEPPLCLKISWVREA